MKNNPVVVGIADAGIVTHPQELITYALGSCVGICLYERHLRLAGMAHILLPAKADAIDRKNPYKFADSACSLLLQDMMRMGAERSYITAKIAGGARMFSTGGNIEGIGERNIAAVRAALHQHKIRIIAEDVGKDYGRTIIFHASNGMLTVKTVKYGITVI